MTVVPRTSSNNFATLFLDGMSHLESEQSGAMTPMNRVRLQEITTLLTNLIFSMGRRWSVREEWEKDCGEEESLGGLLQLKKLESKELQEGQEYEKSPTGLYHLKSLGLKTWEEYHAFEKTPDGLSHLRELEANQEGLFRGTMVRFIAENSCWFDPKKTDEVLFFQERLKLRLVHFFQRFSSGKSWEDRLERCEQMCIAMKRRDSLDRSYQRASSLERLRGLLSENPPSEKELEGAMQVFNRLKDRPDDRIWDYLKSFYKSGPKHPELTQEAVQFLAVGSKLLNRDPSAEDESEDLDLRNSWLRMAGHLTTSIFWKHTQDDQLKWSEPTTWHAVVKETVQKQKDVELRSKKKEDELLERLSPEERRRRISAKKNNTEVPLNLSTLSKEAQDIETGIGLAVERDLRTLEPELVVKDQYWTDTLRNLCGMPVERELKVLDPALVAQDQFWTDALRNYFRYQIQKKVKGKLEIRSFPKWNPALDAQAAREVLHSLREISSRDRDLLNILQLMFSQTALSTLSTMLVKKREELKGAGVDLLDWTMQRQSIEQFVLTKNEDGSFFIENHFELSLAAHPSARDNAPCFKRRVIITHTITKDANQWRVSDPLIP